jgi:hypothetical protein
VLANDWFTFPLIAQYNVRAPAYPQTFHPASMNAGAPWTWSTMVGDVWGKMSALLGAYPGFPQGVAPAGVPEGFRLVGVPAWTALCDLLEHVGLTVACDLTRVAPYTVVQMGATDAAFTALQSQYATNLEDDLEWIDTGAGRVPKAVLVLFRRRNSVYGTEETVTYRSDGPYQWDQTPYYSVSVAAPATFAGSVGSHYIWSDFTVRYDLDNQPLAADVTTATTIAQERVTQYFGKIYRQTAGFMTRTYAGALPFATGSQVDGVAWKMDHSRERSGWVTELVRGRHPAPWSELWD